MLSNFHIYITSSSSTLLIVSPWFLLSYILILYSLNIQDIIRSLSQAPGFVSSILPLLYNFVFHLIQKFSFPNYWALITELPLEWDREISSGHVFLSLFSIYLLPNSPIFTSSFPLLLNFFLWLHHSSMCVNIFSLIPLIPPWYPSLFFYFLHWFPQ